MCSVAVKGGERVRGCNVQCIIQIMIESEFRVVARIIKIVRVGVIQKGGGGDGVVRTMKQHVHNTTS